MSVPNARGHLIDHAPLGEQSWFRCGGSADKLFKPADNDDLIAYLKHHPIDEPITIIGGLANTIIRDGGIRGVTIQLDKAFSSIDVQESPLPNEVLIYAGCGALNGSIAAAAVKNGIGGLEFLSGIPGSLGGALRMNAGAYGREVADCLVEIHALDLSGNPYVLRPYPNNKDIMDHGEFMQINLSYRHNDAPAYLIFTHAVLKGMKEDYDTVKTRINDIKAKRNESQPIKEKTGGSTFANPSPEELRRADLPHGTRAWEIVDKVGGRGLRIGGAQMSEKHCNFMINTGDATAKDLEMLGDEIITRAYDEYGLHLHWEIKRIGEKRLPEAE